MVMLPPRRQPALGLHLLQIPLRQQRVGGLRAEPQQGQVRFGVGCQVRGLEAGEELGDVGAVAGKPV